MKIPLSDRFNRFMAYGISGEMTEWEVRRIRLLNFFYLVATVTYFAGVIETFLVDGRSEGFLILIFALVFQLGLIPMLMKKSQAAEAFFLFAGNVTLFVFDNHYGKDAGTWLYYFPFMAVIAFLVDFKKTIPVLFHLVSTFLFLGAGFIFKGKLLYKEFPKEIIDASFIFSFFISAFAMAAITISILQMIYRQYTTFLQRMEERRIAEESMKAAIREKETLLAEIHHRVKNNLAVISSLLNLQMNTVENEYTREVLRESRNRVASMALIHQKLYNSPNAEEIDFGKYSSELVEEIRHSYSETITEKIRVDVEAEPCSLSLTIAIPCGLILNELLSNCYKHAFPGKRAGTIRIHSGKKSDGKGFALHVIDDGIGLPAGFTPGNSDTLGVSIIQSLAEQVEAQWEMGRGEKGGTFFHMEFLTPGEN